MSVTKRRGEARWGGALLAIFVLTRLLGAWWADHPERYGSRQFPITTDVSLYQFWAESILRQGKVPYAEVAIEYPPGVLAFIAAPQLVASERLPYRRGLIALMLLTDLAGLIGLRRLAARGGLSFGVWLWVVGLPLLGPLVYVRLDLVPAVATIWAVGQAAANAWMGAGAWLGLGAAVKGYPILFLPVGFVLARSRRAFVLGATALILLPLLPLAGIWRPMFHRVVVFHAARGIHAESTWGVLLSLASLLGYRADYQFTHGALQVGSAVTPLLKAVTAVVALGALGAGVWLAGRRIATGHRARLAEIMFATLATALAGSSLFSPQYVTWLIALGAAALCFRETRITIPALLVIPIAALTQLLYPFAYHHIVARQPPALMLLLTRNVLVWVAGLGAFALMRTRGHTD